MLIATKKVYCILCFCFPRYFISRIHNKLQVAAYVNGGIERAQTNLHTLATLVSNMLIGIQSHNSWALVVSRSQLVSVADAAKTKGKTEGAGAAPLACRRRSYVDIPRYVCSSQLMVEMHVSA